MGFVYSQSLCTVPLLENPPDLEILSKLSKVLLAQHQHRQRSQKLYFLCTFSNIFDLLQHLLQKHHFEDPLKRDKGVINLALVDSQQFFKKHPIKNKEQSSYTIKFFMKLEVFAKLNIRNLIGRNHRQATHQTFGPNLKLLCQLMPGCNF